MAERAARLSPLEGVVYGERAIAEAVAALARRIAADTVGSEPLLLVGVLKGAAFLACDLARALPPVLDVRLDFLAVSSYGHSHRSTGRVRLFRDTTESIEGKHVVIVEDIVETGLTLEYLLSELGARRPASLRACVLLDKPFRRVAPVRPEYVAFEAPDAFIVGYGLDYQEKYRNLPYLARLRSEALDG